MIDKRRLKRRHLIYYLRIFDVKSGDLVGHMVDITTEGFMLMSEREIEPSRTFTFRMDLPAYILGKKSIVFETTSVWSREDINPDFFNTGFRLQNINEEEVTIIKRMIYEYGFRD